ncbi:isochorismatase family cysteine hydrolase [Hathewaya histolytica]|uniref:Nicotinamidase-like amidase n=1 Tax=Hathewaya histolytica TaxID=1498 RepID=A0A4U9RDX1_HATHI|nr:isochorismatase family cysteine hydrolase [Hathewaya histolytica]VTQ89416.1 nicotinamidase-like amidase [Hathewaya histolytica]
MILNRNLLSYEGFQEEFKIIVDNIDKAYEKVISVNNLPSNTVLVIIDMINGFSKGGNLYSKNMENLIPNIVDISTKFHHNNYPILAYKDSHEKSSIEFDSYPTHCVVGTEECELISELKNINSIIQLEKNSTNAFLSYNPEEVLKKHFGKENEFNNYVVVGGCTDICIYQFALTLKTYFNEHNRNSRVIVPVNMVDTFSANGHNDDISNILFLNSMIANGIEVIKTIE